jgi:hypothetical protein
VNYGDLWSFSVQKRSVGLVLIRAGLSAHILWIHVSDETSSTGLSMSILSGKARA